MSKIENLSPLGMHCIEAVLPVQLLFPSGDQSCRESKILIPLHFSSHEGLSEAKLIFFNYTHQRRPT